MDAGIWALVTYETYRQHTQQRRLSRILKTNHGNVHLRRPTVEKHIAALSQPNLGYCGDGPGSYFRRTPRRRLNGTAAHLPEHPQEPVIDRPKNTRHVGVKSQWLMDAGR
jgi:hypothetical protein